MSNLELRKSGRVDVHEDDLPDRDITETVIGSAIAVHKALGPGFLESIYEEALCIELSSRDVPIERQKNIRLTYRDRLITIKRVGREHAIPS